MRLLSFSKSSLRTGGTAWVRLGWHGPGVRVYDRRAEPFSIRFGLRRSLRLGRYAVCLMPAIGKWP